MPKIVVVLTFCMVLLYSCQRDSNGTISSAAERDEYVQLYDETGRYIGFYEAEEAELYVTQIVEASTPPPEPEEETEITIEHFFGYYFYARSLDNVLILRLARDEHLFLQEMVITDGQLYEGPKTVLDEVIEGTQEWSQVIVITFRETGRGGWSAPRVEFRPEFSNVSIHYNQRIKSNQSTIFTRNTEDVIRTFHSVFSREGQERFMGVFAFYRYEIVNIHNTPHPITEDIANDRIIVEMGEDGYLIASRAGGVSVGRFGQWESTARFFIHDNGRGIWSSAANGTFSGGSFGLYYEDVDTIIYRHSSFFATDDPADSASFSNITFRIIYRRVAP